LLILVNSHPRSGAHLLIDAIVKNVPDVVLPSDSAVAEDAHLGSLLLNDERTNDAFAEWIDRSATGCVPIRNHLTPTAIVRAIESADNSEVTSKLLRHVWDEAVQFYIYRDPRDVFVSFYKQIHPNREVDFSTFLHQVTGETLKEMPAGYDGCINKPHFWRTHVEQWMAMVPMRVTAVAYEDLRDHFDLTFRQIMQENEIPVGRTIINPQKKSPRPGGMLDKVKRKLRGEEKGHARPRSVAIDALQDEMSWDEYFSPEDMALTLAEVGETMVHLGYATE
jgi:hypothetical protein